jgi:hypothetical protein
MASVTLGGNPVTVNGNLPKKGETAADFTLTGKDLKDVSLKDFAGKRKVLNIVPSLDAPRMREIGEGLQRGERQVRRDGEHRDIRFLAQLVPEIRTEPYYPAALTVLN